MIKDISECDMAPFYELMGEIECGRRFKFDNPKHIDWIKKRIAVHYFRGAKFFGYFGEDNAPIGIAGLLIEEGLESLRPRCELLDIGVYSNYRRKGFGSELLLITEKYAKDLGIYCMFMSTYARSYKVISFYGKNGYVPVATLPDVHGPNDEGIIFMRKILE